MGKTNVGKTTFFNAATLQSAPVENRPFTTIAPNIGLGYIRVPCACKTLGVEDRPLNSLCIERNRFVPVKLVDVAGLVPGASSGHGLGNQFLDNLRNADILVHVVSAAGDSDDEGRVVPPGTSDPLHDIEFVEREFDLWVLSIIEKDWPKLARVSEADRGKLSQLLAERLSGLSISEYHILRAVEQSGLDSSKPTHWSSEERLRFVSTLRRLAKPSVIAANKADMPQAKENIEKLKKTGRVVVPCAAEAELLLRRAAQRGLIHYLPGDPDFSVAQGSTLTKEQAKALEAVRKLVLETWKNAGVQQAINAAYRDLLGAIVVYPVEDEQKYADKKGNVLPDAVLLPRGATARDLAYAVHTELGESFLYAVNARRKMRVGADEPLEDGDVVKIVATAKKT